MSELMKNVNARSKLAGTNKLEILLFTLGLDKRTGRRENFGINVFKVREVMRTPEITRAPDMPPSVKGMVSLRGELVPVVDLQQYVGVDSDAKTEIMIVTEYNGHTQGFLVEGVDTILRLEWSQMRVPPDMLSSQMGGLVTAVTELGDGRLIMMVDVEKILSESTSSDEHLLFRGVDKQRIEGITVFFADDSVVARKQIQKTLDNMGARYMSAINGKRAWDELQKLAAMAEMEGKAVKDLVNIIVTDVEMPEMDGYMLTKMVKSDPRFHGIPVIMHSSLSGASNQKLGQSVGVDDYITKFEPQRFAEALLRAVARLS